MDICTVGDYDHTGKFDNYDSQDVLLFDEFDSQIKITKMNTYLDGRPIPLPARNKDRFPVYTKVFIVSNYPLDSLYKKEREQDGKQPSFEGFLRRIHEVIYMPDRNVYIWQKGRPTDETIATLKEQGAKVTLLPQIAEQTKMKGVQE